MRQKMFFKKLIPTLIGFGVLVPSAYFTYQEYVKFTTPSSFELAANRLGFNGYKKAKLHVSAAEQQEAMLKQLQIAGFFQAEKLWQDINHLGVNDPLATYTQIYSAIKKSKADQSDPTKFNAKILRKNLGSSVFPVVLCKNFIPHKIKEQSLKK